MKETAHGSYNISIYYMRQSTGPCFESVHTIETQLNLVSNDQTKAGLAKLESVKPIVATLSAGRKPSDQTQC